MAFDDAPQVDDASERSEESENAVRLLFTKKKGFILREVEKNDYGVDFTVELLDANKGATAQDFAIQLKSTEVVNRVSLGKSEPCVSYPIKTSRLGYLCRRLPGMGLVILYEASTGKCYFDYAEDIVVRITTDRGNDDWKTKNGVNFLIPAWSVLTLQELPALLIRMQNRFQQHEALIQKHGKAFGLMLHYQLPSQEHVTALDLEDPNQVREWLLEMGGYLLNSQDTGRLAALFDRLRYNDITSSDDLVFLAAMAYSGTGNLAQADLYTRLCKQRLAKFPSEQREAIHYTDLSMQAQLGRISSAIYTKQLAKLQKTFQNSTISLSAKLTMVSQKLVAMDPTAAPDSRIYDEIMALFDEVDQLSLEENLKQRFILKLADRLFAWSHVAFRYSHFIAQLEEARGHVLSEDERLRLYRFPARSVSRGLHLVQDVAKFAEEHDDRFLLAAAYRRATDFDLALALSTVGSGDSPQIEGHGSDHYENLLHYAVESARIFEREGFVRHAYDSLRTAYDVIVVFENTFEGELSRSKTWVQEYLSKYEELLGVEREPSHAESVLQKRHELSSMDNQQFHQLLSLIAGNSSSEKDTKS